MTDPTRDYLTEAREYLSGARRTLPSLEHLQAVMDLAERAEREHDGMKRKLFRILQLLFFDGVSRSVPTIHETEERVLELRRAEQEIATKQGVIDAQAAPISELHGVLRQLRQPVVERQFTAAEIRGARYLRVHASDDAISALERGMGDV